MNVTAGYTFTGPDDPITFAKLNLLGLPTVAAGTNENTLATLPAAASNNLFLARSTTGAGNYEALDTTTTGLGFYTGAGSTVTQASNKSTAVTCNAMTGLVTMNNAALNDATNVTFQLNNSKIAATDFVCAMHASAGTAAAYQVTANTVAAGSVQITVRNVSGGPLSEAITIRYLVLKSVNA